MTWFEAALLGAVLVGALAGTVLIVRSPNFWFGLIAAAVQAALPFLLKRMSPKDEAAWREAEKAGRGDEWLRKKQGSLKD